MYIPIELLSNKHICLALHATENLLFYFIEHCFCSVAKLCPLFETPWIAARQASLSFTISQSLLKFMSIESVMLSHHLIICCPLLLLPSIFPSIRVLRPWNFSGKSTGVGCQFLLQGIFPTQGLNPGLPHCRQTLYLLSHQGSPGCLVGSLNL